MLIPALSPLGIGIIKKIKAKMQNREGAGIFQPYRDLWKLFHKDEILSQDASWIFRFAPYIIFAVTLVVGWSIPLFSSLLPKLLTGDMLMVIYTLAIGTFFLALAGLDTGGAFGGFGSSREMTLAALAEGGLIFSLLTPALICRSSNLSVISSEIAKAGGDALLPVGLAFAAFFIVLLAENSRFPFDNPATHLELTMIHEAMILEYSGKRLALMEWAAANKLLIFACLGINLFFPWGMAANPEPLTVLLGLGVFALKLLVLYAAVAVIESTMAKYRLFRLPGLLAIAFILNLFAIGLMK